MRSVSFPVLANLLVILNPDHLTRILPKPLRTLHIIRPRRIPIIPDKHRLVGMGPGGLLNTIAQIPPALVLPLLAQRRIYTRRGALLRVLHVRHYVRVGGGGFHHFLHVDLQARCDAAGVQGGGVEALRAVAPLFIKLANNPSMSEVYVPQSRSRARYSPSWTGHSSSSDRMSLSR